MEWGIVSIVIAALLAVVVWLAKQSGHAEERRVADEAAQRDVDAAHKVMADVMREPHPIDRLRDRWTR